MLCDVNNRSQNILWFKLKIRPLRKNLFQIKKRVIKDRYGDANEILFSHADARQ